MSIQCFKQYYWAYISVLLLSGCGRGQAESARKQETSHLRSVVGLYNFATSTLGHRPGSEAEFKSFINTNAKPMIESLQLASLDELFISERDGQPLVVIYGKPPAGMTGDLVAYEQTGVSGKRSVGYALGMIEEVDEQRFAELTGAAAKPGK